MDRRVPDNLGGGGPPKKNRNGKCSSCCAKLVSLLCSNVGICLLVVLYTVAGAFLFTSIEGNYNEGLGHMVEPSLQHVTEELETTVGPGKAEPVIDSHQNLVKMRQETVEKLWTITESLNILYRANWTRVAERELEKFSELIMTQVKQHDQLAAASRDAKITKPQEHQWSFAGSFLYSLTVITTIGYGAVAPQTGLGKIVTILYALLGIPIMLLYLSSVGDLLSRILKWFWIKLCRCGKKRKKSQTENLHRNNNPLPGSYNSLDPKKLGKWSDAMEDPLESETGAVPVTLCLLLMVAYITGGAAVFAYTHNWSFLNAIFFCFTALTTIGFGELSPGLGTRTETGAQISLLGASLYLLVGMALIATCFNLMQEQMTSRGSNFSRKFGSNHHHHRFHLDDT